MNALEINELTGQLIRAAIEVHKTLGPGLLESVYEACLCMELDLRSVPHQRQKEIPIEYGGRKLGCGYRLDLVVAGCLIIEIKACDALQPGADWNGLAATGRRAGLIQTPFHKSKAPRRGIEFLFRLFEDELLDDSSPK